MLSGVSDTAELERRVAALEDRLAAVEAVQEIHRLKARYGSLIDTRYTEDGALSGAALEAVADEIVQLFTPDAVWDGGERLGEWRGREQIRKRFLEPTLRFTLHYFLKPVVEVTGDRARGTWDILAPITLESGKPGWMAGVEEDEYARHEGRWLHSRMKLQVIFLGPEMRGWDRRPRS